MIQHRFWDFPECVAILSFEQQMALHALEMLVSKSLRTLEPKIIIHKIRKGWSELQELIKSRSLKSNGDMD